MKSLWKLLHSENKGCIHSTPTIIVLIFPLKLYCHSILHTSQDIPTDRPTKELKLLHLTSTSFADNNNDDRASASDRSHCSVGLHMLSFFVAAVSSCACGDQMPSTSSSSEQKKSIRKMWCSSTSHRGWWWVAPGGAAAPFSSSQKFRLHTNTNARWGWESEG